MSEITLTFPDGAKRSVREGITGKELAESIAKSLAKRAVAMVVDGRLADLADPIECRRDREDRLAHRSRGAGADPSRCGARDGGGRAGAVAGHPGDHRSR